MCPYMALNTMEKLYVALRDLQPRIEIEEGLRLAAKKSARPDAGNGRAHGRQGRRRQAADQRRLIVVGGAAMGAVEVEAGHDGNGRRRRARASPHWRGRARPRPARGNSPDRLRSFVGSPVAASNHRRALGSPRPHSGADPSASSTMISPPLIAATRDQGMRRPPCPVRRSAKVRRPTPIWVTSPSRQ